MDEQEFWDAKWTACEGVLAALLHDDGEAPPDRIASRVLLSRLFDCAQSVSALEALSRTSGKDHALDSMCLVRVAYDLHLQILWLLDRDSERLARSHDYLDFVWIETLRQRSVVEGTGAPFFQQLEKRMGSNARFLPARAAQDSEIKRIGLRFLTDKGRRELGKQGTEYLIWPRAEYRKHWYAGDLSNLAQVCGLRDEARLFLQGGGHHAVHSSPLALLRGPAMDIASQKLSSARFAMRCAHRAASVFSVNLGQFDEAILAYAGKPVTEFVIERSAGAGQG